MTTEEIVFNLRVATADMATEILYEIMSDGANEIERLKAELEKWRNVADIFYSRHDRGRTCNLISPCHECDAYEKAVRDE